MPITSLHWHRPSFGRSQEADEQSSSASGRIESNVKKINLGFFKVKIHQAGSEKAYFKEVNAWASQALRSSGSRFNGDRNPRQIAQKLKAYFKENNANVPLDLKGLDLADLPPLPAWIKNLDLSGNRISSAESLKDLPASVEVLNLSGDLNLPCTETLELDLPALKKLIASYMRIRGLSLDKLPALEVLNANLSGLTELSGSLSASLKHIHLRNSRIVTLPANIISQLGSGCTIDLRDTPLDSRGVGDPGGARATRMHLDAAINAPGYQGPQFTFTPPRQPSASRTAPGHPYRHLHVPTQPPALVESVQLSRSASRDFDNPSFVFPGGLGVVQGR
jgi:hypothetical protein